MTFSKMLENDIKNVFLNIDELGELHTIEGKQIICIFDDEALRERQAGNELGVSESGVLLFAYEKDLPYKKGAGGHLDIDGKPYLIDDWSVNKGLAQIALSQNRTA